MASKTLKVKKATPYEEMRKGRSMLVRGLRNTWDGLEGLVGGAIHAVGSTARGVGYGVARAFQGAEEGIEEAGKGVGYGVHGVGYGVRGAGRLVRGIGKRVAVAEQERKGFVRLSYKDVSNLMSLEPEDQAKVLGKYLKKSKAKEYVEVPTKDLARAVDEARNHGADTLAHSLSVKVAKSEGDFVKIPEKEFKEYNRESLKDQPDNPLKEYLLRPKEVEGGYVKIPKDDLAVALSAYRKSREYSPLEQVLSKAAAVLMFAASIVALVPSSMTGYSVFEGAGGFSLRFVVGVLFLFGSLLMFRMSR